MSELIPAATEFKERLLQLALDGLVSPHTRRAYRTALDEFLTWAQYQQPSTLSKALVQRYKTMVIAKGLAPATVNQRLSRNFHSLTRESTALVLLYCEFIGMKAAPSDAD